MTKKLLALLFAALMLAAVCFGCTSEVVEPAPAEEPAAAAEPAAEPEVVDEEVEVIDIIVNFLAFGPMPQETAQTIADAVNEITVPKIGVHVTFEYYDPTGYGEHISLAMASQEQIDLLMLSPIPNSSFQMLSAQGQLQDMRPYLEANAPETLELLGDLINGTTVNGQVLATTNYRTLNSNVYIVMDQAVLDELGLTEKAQAIKTWTEYEEILAAVKEAKPELAPIVSNDGAGTIIAVASADNSGENFADHSMFDTLGDTNRIIAVDEATDKVFSFMESETYLAMLKRTEAWYNAGYVYKDAATDDTMGQELIKAGKAFSLICQSEIGVETAKAEATGRPCVCVQLNTGRLDTSSTTKFAYGIPVVAKEPDAAAKFLNEMYTNPDIVNLLAWGIEGRDYVLTEDGQANFPEGVTAETAAYHTADFLYGNQFLVYPWMGNGGDFRVKAMEFFKAAPVSKYMGCAVDTSSVSNEVTACVNVVQEYRTQLETGMVNVDTVYPEFVAKLQAAGIEKIVACYQEQLDAWLAAQ